MATRNDVCRFVLGAVARGELVRDAYDTDRRWQDGAAEPLSRDEAAALRNLEAEGLAVPPQRKPGNRADLRWELTDKALEG